MVVISHGDADGVCCVAILYTSLNTSRLPVFFTSPVSLKDTLCKTMIKRELNELFIFDLSGSRETVRIASAWKKVTWIDHHSWEVKESFENVAKIIKPYPSATQVAAEYFKVDSEIVKIANEIDTNNVNSDSAEFLRDLISAVKWKYAQSPLLGVKLRGISISLAFKGISALEIDENNVKLIEEYKKWLEINSEKLIEKLKVEEVNGMKIAVFESTKFLPVYFITNKLFEHPKAPFDIIGVLVHRAIKNNIITKVELRSHTGMNVLDIAKALNGGGHVNAAGASTDKIFRGEELIELVRKVKENHDHGPVV